MPVRLYTLQRRNGYGSLSMRLSEGDSLAALHTVSHLLLLVQLASMTHHVCLHHRVWKIWLQ